MELNPFIFREYDIRGTVDEDLTPEFAHALGRCFALLAAENNCRRLAVSFDCRPSSETYAQAAARGIADQGLACTIIGMGPTPQLYWALSKKDFDAGIQITGSHCPPEMNGFKLCLGTRPVFGKAIQDLMRRLSIIESISQAPEKGDVREISIRRDYIDDLIKISRARMGKRKLKVVVDAGNGVAGLVGPEILRGLGLEVLELYCEPDGNFPNHHPDPVVPEYLRDLTAKVKESGADFGVGWDGDGDRIGLIDEKGNFIFGDMILLLFGRELLKEVPGATIIGDVKCSSFFFEDLKKRGAKTIMWKSGHSLIKDKLVELGGAMGGEFAGHIVFHHNFYGFDDGVYCASRLAEILSNTAAPLSELLSDVPAFFNTPEIKIDCPDGKKFLLIEQIQKAFPGLPTIMIDGIRIEFEKGWALVRASNTTPMLILRFEAESQQELDNYRNFVIEKVEKIKNDLLSRQLEN